MLFSTTEPFESLDVCGKGVLIQARVLRLKKDLKGEHNAKEVSDALPFVEYELHRILVNKLKVRGMNAVFGVRTKMSLSDHTIIGTATATACFISALPNPTQPKLLCSTPWQQKDPNYLTKTNERLKEFTELNERRFGVSNSDVEEKRLQSTSSPISLKEEDSIPNEAFNEDVDFELMAKDTCVLEIDDTEDVDVLDSLLDKLPPTYLDVYSTEAFIGLDKAVLDIKAAQSFVQVWRGRIHHSTRDFSSACERLFTAAYFKARRLKPCVLAGLRFHADLDDENELQLCLYGNVIPQHLQETDYAEDHVILTPLSSLPNGKVEKFFGNVNFFLIRETSSLRESGGLNAFIHGFVCEVHAIVRAHVKALGGNAVLGFFISEFVVLNSQHKNTSQCLIHVGGDAVKIDFRN